jgi:phosphate transport system ATP-binding protein
MIQDTSRQDMVADDSLLVPSSQPETFMDSHIQVHNLNAYYGDSLALSDINFDIPRRQITVIMGPSGCGKTTLLKSFNRFLELTDHTRISGQVLIDGEDIYAPGVDVTEIRKKVGLLAQRPYPLPMSIYDNVAYGLRIHNMTKNGHSLNTKVQHYLEIAGLWDEVKDRLHKPATGLSIGQQQRLCLARGLAIEPEILLGDEPTSALDPISTQLIEQRLHELSRQYTIVLVTHILRQAKRLADYVVFMYLGELVEHGPAHEVFANPRKERTRAYLEGQF